MFRVFVYVFVWDVAIMGDWVVRSHSPLAGPAVTRELGVTVAMGLA